LFLYSLRIQSKDFILIFLEKNKEIDLQKDCPKSCPSRAQQVKNLLPSQTLTASVI